MTFKLAPQLENDCAFMADWPLCRVLLMNDSQFPWFILVPRIEGVSEIIDLTQDQQRLYLEESAKLSVFLKSYFKPDKLNIAALGNMVPQLHIHHIARFKQDKAWPKPVWGMFEAKPYNGKEIEKLKTVIQGL